MYANSYLVNLLFFLMLLIVSIRSEAVKNKPDRKLPFHEWIKQFLNDPQYSSMIKWVGHTKDRDTFNISNIKTLSEKWRDYKGSTISQVKLCNNMRKSLRDHYGKGVEKAKAKGCYSFIKGYVELQKKPRKSHNTAFIPWLKACLNTTDYSCVIRWIEPIEEQPTFEIIDKVALAKLWQDKRKVKKVRPHDLIRMLDNRNGKEIKRRNEKLAYSLIENSDGQQQIDSLPANDHESQLEPIVTQECSFGDESVEVLFESDELKYVPATEEMTAAQVISCLL